MKKRILSLLLALLMVVSILPMPTYAEDAPDVTVMTTEPDIEAATEGATELPCTTCSTPDCTSDHAGWCADCKVDNCGKIHVFCEICHKNDCGVNHGAIISMEAPSDANTVADDSSDSPYLANRGRKATINPIYVGSLYICADPSLIEGWSSVQPTSDPLFTAELTLEIIGVYDNGTELWYEVIAAEGYTLPASLSDKPWVFQNVIGENPDYDSLILMEEEPVNPCGCCDNCTGADGCECGCEACDFREKDESEVPSISATVNGQTVTVMGDALPEGAELKVQEAITGMDGGFAWDIQILDAEDNAWQPTQSVSVTLPVPGVADGEYIELVHFLENEQQITDAIAAGNVLTDDWVSTFLPAASAAYLALTGEENTVAFEVFDLQAADGKISFNPESFSIYTWNGSSFSKTSTGDTDKIVFVATLTQGSANGSTYYVTPGQTIHCDRGGTGAVRRQWQTSHNNSTWAYNTNNVPISQTSGNAMEDGSGAEIEFTVDSTAAVGATFWIKARVRQYLRWDESVVKFVVVEERRVNYNGNGGTPAVSSNMAITDGGSHNQNVTLPNATRTGYTFLGWYTAASGGTRVGGSGTSYMPASSGITLYAQWEPIKYTVKFDPNTANAGGGTVTGSMSNIAMTYDVETTLPRSKYVNSGDGYVFLGWATSPTGDVVYKDGAKVSNLTTTNNGTVTLYAKWKYGLASTVYIGINNTYHDPNGTYTAGGVTIKSYHTYPNEPAQMTGNFDRVTDKNGGWTYDSASEVPLKGQANAYIGGNIFNSPDYEMTYVSGENTLGIADPTGQTVRAMLKFTEADYDAMIAAWLNGMRTTLVGYGDTTFDWQNAKAEDFTMVPYVIKFQNYDSWYIDMVVVPKALYTLAYDGNIENGYTADFKGVAFPPSAQYKDGDSVTVVTTPIGYQNNGMKVTKVVDGHTYTAAFQYWYDADGNTYGGNSGNNTITLTKDTVLYAKWEYPDASYGNLDITKNVVDRDSYSDPDASQKFTFTFKTSAAGSYSYIIYDRSANVKGSGSIANNGTFQLQDGWRIRITDLPKGTTYSVTETAVNYYAVSGTVSGTISAGATTYATVTNTYQKHANYEVRHHLQNADGNGYTEQTADRQVLYGVIGTQTAAVAKTYAGYKANAINQQTITADGAIVDIYYDTVTSYTVTATIDSNGTIEGNASQSVEYGEQNTAITFKANAGYKIKTITINGVAQTVTNDKSYTFQQTITENTTVSVTTERDVFTVTFVDDDGTVLLPAAEYAYGTLAEDITKPDDPSKEATTDCSYQFIGWEPEITDVTDNATYRAVYKKLVTLSGEIDHGTHDGPLTVEYGADVTIMFTPAPGYALSTYHVQGEEEKTITSPTGFGVHYSKLFRNTHITVTTVPIEYTITYELNGGELGEGITNPEKYTIETETFTLNNPAKAGYKFLGWATTANTAAGAQTVTIEQGTTGDKIFYAVWERSLVDLTVTAECADQQQSFIFTVSGVRSDGVAFDPIDVVLCSDNGFKITIKDLPVGTYTVAEKDGWSWREDAVESRSEDLTTESRTVSFDFGVVDDLHWLSGCSYKRKKGGS